MPNVTFIRHAKATLNKEGKFAGRTDCDIVEEGLEELKRNFNYNESDFDYVYCSPLKRTQQTLNAIMPGREPIIDDRIIERYIGDWEDRPYSDFSDALIESYAKGYYDPPNSESYSAIKKRVCSFVEELFEKYEKDDTILVVSHAGVLRQVRDTFLPNMPKTKIKNSQALVVTNEDFDKYKEKEKEEERA